MCSKFFIVVLAIFAWCAMGSAQSYCDNPYPDSCQVPDTCCSVGWDRCPWGPQFNGMDVVYLVSYFKGGPRWQGIYSKFDVNCNCSVNGMDIVYILNYLKGRGPEPKCCLYQCRLHPWTGSIGNRIWYDDDRDGIQDAGESGQPHLDVNLLDCSDPPNILATDTTDAEGHYQFVGLAPGSYRIKLRHSDDFNYSPMDQGDDDEIDSDANPLTGITDCFELPNNGIDNSRDIGFYYPRTVGDIGDFVWNDLDRDGIQDDGEPGIEGVTLRIHRRVDSTLVETTISDENGYYMFDSLNQGHYYIEVDAPEGFVFTLQNQGDNDSLDSDVNPETGIMSGDELDENETDLTWDAGMHVVQGTGSIGNFIWHDANRDGIQDDGESGMARMQVDLVDCADPPNILASQDTDLEGHYLFTGLAAGNYRVHLWHSDEFYYSPKDRGDNDEIDSDADTITGVTDCFELAAGEVDNSRDIGIYWPRYRGDLGDFVWNDRNHDGIQSREEPGIEDITLYLYSRIDSAVVDTAITDENGHYLFADLYSGYYYIQVIPPDGFIFTLQDQGDNDSIDSDVNPATGIMTGDELYDEETDLTWDAGMYSIRDSLGCTRPSAFWKNHAGFQDQLDSVTQYLPLWIGLPDSSRSIHITNSEEAVGILRMQGYGHPSNQISKLYAELLAAKLNIACGTSGDDIVETIEESDIFLSAHDWRDWDNLGEEIRQAIIDWKQALADYNHGRIGPGPCDIEEEDTD